MPNGTEAADLGNALLANFYSVLTTGAQTAGTYLSYIDGGVALTPNDLAFLTDLSWMASTNPNSSHLSATQLMQAAHNFASVVDAIPTGIGNWTPSGSTVASAYYETFLKQAVVAETTLTAAQQSELATAKAAIQTYGASYRRYRNLYDKAVAAHNALNMRTPPADPAAVNAASTALRNALSDWEDLGNKQAYESASATVANLTGGGAAEELQDLTNTYLTYIESYQLTDGTQFAPVLAVPPDFFTRGVQWNRFSFDSSSVAKTTSGTNSTFTGDLSDVAGLFLYNADVSGTGTWQSSDVSASTMNVSFEYMVVDLDRTAWFDTILLTSRAWWFTGMTAQKPTSPIVLSDGVPPPNTTGEWQMWAESVVFIRNLTIDFGSQDTQSAQRVMSLQEDAQVKFLIFPLAGETTDVTNTTTNYNFESSGSSITAPQMQMMFFLCRLMPREPNPLPTLLPQR